MIPPARFIFIAEEVGLIMPIGEWVLRQAVAWKKAGLPEFLVAVNISAVRFKRGDVEQSVIGALEESGCDEAQGFYFARPMPAKEFVFYLSMARFA